LWKGERGPGTPSNKHKVEGKAKLLAGENHKERTSRKREKREIGGYSNDLARNRRPYPAKREISEVTGVQAGDHSCSWGKRTGPKKSEA